MKLLIMPPAQHLRSELVDHKSIVARVLKCRPEIHCKRSEVIKTPSIIRAEFTREREQLDVFRSSLKQNISEEKDRQRDRFNKIKAKYDREGIEVVEDES